MLRDQPFSRCEIFTACLFKTKIIYQNSIRPLNRCRMASYDSGGGGGGGGGGFGLNWGGVELM